MLGLVCRAQVGSSLPADGMQPVLRSEYYRKLRSKATRESPRELTRSTQREAGRVRRDTSNTLSLLTRPVLPKGPARFITVVDLEAVVTALAPRLIAYAVARTGCPGLAEDIAHDALTALVRRWRHAGPPDSPEAFAFAIVKRRAGRAVAKRALLAPLDALRHAVGHEPGIGRVLEDRHELSFVRSALRTLSRPDREALVLRAVGELSYEEIAVLMHASPSAVKMRVSRARKRLALLLQEHVDGRRTRTA
jgi:RNA polymerase sigma-70 factor (ECF subfamily)